METTISPELIIRMVSSSMSVPRDKLAIPDHMPGSRKREYVEARQVSMYFIKENVKNITLSTIGSYFGDRDHATVLHACKTVNNMLDTDKKYKKKFDEMKEEISKVSAKTSMETLVCSKCGSDEIFVHVWVNPNCPGNVKPKVNDNDEAICSICGETKAIIRAEFQKLYGIK